MVSLHPKRVYLGVTMSSKVHIREYYSKILYNPIYRWNNFRQVHRQKLSTVSVATIILVIFKIYPHPRFAQLGRDYCIISHHWTITQLRIFICKLPKKRFSFCNFLFKSIRKYFKETIHYSRHADLVHTDCIDKISNIWNIKRIINIYNIERCLSDILIQQ